MHFEWDSAKAAKNLRKHQVALEEASSVFYDPLAVTGADPDHSEDEKRLVTFGVSSTHHLLVVSHTERGEAIRIISARRATHHERQIYEED
ncbi:MAG: BrnT family toxin [Terriglobia bacterium]